MSDPSLPPRPRQAVDGWLRSAFDVAAVGFASITRDGRHVTTNAAYLQHLGLTRRHVVRQPLAGLLSGPAVQLFDQWLADPHSAATLEFSIQQPNGSSHDLIAWISPLPLTEESARAVVQLIPAAATPDATGGLSRFTAVTSATSELIVLVDAEGRIEFANGAAKAAFGDRAEIGCSIGGLLGPGEHDRVNKLLRTSRGPLVETSVRQSNSSEQLQAPLKLRVSEVREPTGRLLGLAYLFSVSPDTSLTETALAATTSPVWVLDGSGPVAASRGARELLGIDAHAPLADLHLRDLMPGWAADELVAHGFGAATRNGRWSAPLAMRITRNHHTGTGAEELLAEVTLSHVAGPPEMWTIAAEPQRVTGPDPLATRDHLTDLPNRVVLIDRLAHAFERASRSGQPTGLVIFDIDHFGPISDAVGPDMSERLLAAVATRLQDNLRPGDTLARSGDDEFAAVRDDLPDIQDAERFAERLRSCVDDPLVIDGVEWFISLSCGVALTQPGVTTVEGLFRNATAALERAKEVGRGRAIVFGQGLREATGRHVGTSRSNHPLGIPAR
ncbi:MAG: diguanylate cyclase (GGDEF)-like protein [Candidatus Poriferisodalaceae bacterium]